MSEAASRVKNLQDQIEELDLDKDETMYQESAGKWEQQAIELESLASRSSARSLFIDPYFETSSDNEKVTWMRPRELTENPSLGIESTDFKQVIQGKLDNCAFISACCSISAFPKLLSQIFEFDQQLTGGSYNGSVRLKVWLHHKWVKIVIDDRLPVKNGKLIYAKCKNTNHFWLPLLEKAFAKLHQGYQNLAGIDSAYSFLLLTSGLALRFNPVNLNHQARIVRHLKAMKDKKSILCILGSELRGNSENKPGGQVHDHHQQRIGHSFSLIDLIETNGSSYLKLRNSQTSMKMRLPESLDIGAPSESKEGIFYIRFDEMFNYFEIMTVLIVTESRSRSDQTLSLNGLFKENQALSKPTEANILKYLNSPHYVLEVKNKKNDPQKLTNMILNLSCNESSPRDYLGMFMLPVRELDNVEKTRFVIYQFHTLSMINSNPLTFETSLLPGRYVICLLINSDKMPTEYFLRLKVDSDSSIQSLKFIKQFMSNSVSLMLQESNYEKIKLVIKKCCVCEQLLDAKFMTDYNSNNYCLNCFDASHRCELCNLHVGNDYYTIENRLTCMNCFNSKFSFIRS